MITTLAQEAQPMQLKPYSLLDYYATSLSVGFKSLLSPHPLAAAARVVNPLSYPRYMEYDLVMRQLGGLEGQRVLDIGSPKLPILLIAKRAHCELYATDIRDYFVPSTRLFLERMGQGDRIGRDVHLEVQDARHLSYPDASFDRVLSISVIEHIPDTGDSAAMREISRVLRKSGVVSITVPFAAAGYREEFVRGPVYERASAEGGTFFQRRYDTKAVYERLVQPSGLKVAEMRFFGEPFFPFEQYWNRVSLRWKVPILWASPFLAKVFLKELDPADISSAVGVALKLEKD